MLLLTTSVYLSLNLLEKKSSPVALLSVFAVAYLVRMDMLLLVLVVLGFIVYHRGFTRANKRSWLLGVTIFGLTVVSYSLFRWIYFHELLPNTYYTLNYKKFKLFILSSMVT